MVPHSNMLWITGVVLVPTSLMGVIIPASGPLASAVAFVVIALAILDATLSKECAAGFEVTMNAVTRMTRDREESLKVQVKTTQGDARSFTLAIAHSDALNPETREMEGVARAGKVLHLSLPCTPRKRGRVEIPFAHLETDSRLRLWKVRKKFPLEAEVRVFPNLQEQRKQTPGWFVRREQSGSSQLRQMGKGREFEMLREYVQGDSYEDIHWRSTAKRRSPVTKMYQIERTQEVYVLIDVSRLSGRDAGELGGETSEDVLEHHIRTAMLLQQIAARQGDLFGLVVYSNNVDRFVRARGGKSHYTSCAETLYNLTTQPVTPDVENLFSFIRTRLRKRALLILLTDLQDPGISAAFQKHVEQISRHHLVFVNSISHPDIEPAFGSVPVHEPADLYDRLARHLQWRDTQNLAMALRQKGVQFHEMSAAASSANVINQYMDVKRRQLL